MQTKDLKVEGELQSKLLVNSVTGYAMYMLDREGAVTRWNAGAERAKGYAEAEVLGRNFSMFYTPEDQASGEPRRALETALETGRFERSEWRVRKDGSRFWASVVIEPVVMRGSAIGFAKITRDITGEREADEQLAAVHRNLKIALTYMSQGLALYDGGGALILANRRLSEMFGVPCEQVRIGMSIGEVMGAIGFSRRRAQRLEVRIHAISPDGQMDQTFEEIGDVHVVSIATRPMPDGGWVMTFEDVTERRRAEMQLAFMAHHDALTSLPNRTFFHERLQQAATQAKRGVPFVLMSLDMNGFKSVNDTLGHAAGDELLQAVAQRLRASLRESDTVARLGGDEFAVIQTGPKSDADAVVLAKRLIHALAQPYLLGGHQVISGCSVGMAMAPRDGSEVDDLLKKADMALYRAKKDETLSYSFFEPELDRRMESRRTLERDLRQALLGDELRLHYQPLVDAQTSEITSYEALVRWQHPTRGMISPADFIPLAEESGLIVPIGEWVVRTACEEAATWAKEVKVAVNLSPAQFKSGRLPEMIAEALSFSGLSAHRLELEITETVLLQNSETTLKALHRLRDLGVRIALDDFGTGYSSLSYLRSFPFDKLKIDRSFVQDLPECRSARAIVQAIAALGASFNMSITAEGVEKLEQMEYLRGEGCNELQGFYLSKPKPKEELVVVRKTAGTARNEGRTAEVDEPVSVGPVNIDRAGSLGSCAAGVIAFAGAGSILVSDYGQ